MHQVIIFVLKSKQIQGIDKIHQSVPVICCFAEASRCLDVGKDLIGSECKTHYDQVKRKWAETCRSLAGGYLQPENQNVPSEEEGWALMSYASPKIPTNFFTGGVLAWGRNRREG